MYRQLTHFWTCIELIRSSAVFSSFNNKSSISIKLESLSTSVPLSASAVMLRYKLYVFQKQKVVCCFFLFFVTLSLMAVCSQEAGLQRIDWPSQIRAELHEPINGSDSSRPVGNLRSKCIARYHPQPSPLRPADSWLFFPPLFAFPVFAALPSCYPATLAPTELSVGPEIMVMNRRFLSFFLFFTSPC